MNHKQGWTITALTAATILALTLALVPSTSVFAAADDRRGGPGGGNGGATAGTALTPLSEVEAEGLQAAILEEYGALNLYSALVDSFGATAPFARIARSEQQHVNALISQAQKLGVSVPENPGLTAAPDFDTLAEACQAGVDAEIADAALYDDLMALTSRADLTQVYTNLQSASLNSHLPAFEACN